MRKNYLLRHCFLASFIFFSSCSQEQDEFSTGTDESVSEGKVLLRKVQSGKQKLQDGSTYVGELMRGEPHGYGKKDFPQGDEYEGQFQQGRAHGHGTYRFKQDELVDRYVGMWANDKWDGYGTLVLSDGSRVTGQWVKDRLEYGDYEGSDGSIRSGKWRGNWDFLEEGFSRDTFGTEYNGIFNSDGSYRSGFINNPNGDIYAGEFLANSYHGKGILEKVDGTLYVGDFEDNQYSGSGMLISSNGSKYTGQFADGLPNGFGVEEQVNGVRYFGTWADGLKEGAGTVDFGNGATYVGVFKNGYAIEGKYDWGDGRVTDSYQDETGTWLDR